jgi:hypothetical protein
MVKQQTSSESAKSVKDIHVAKEKVVRMVKI